MRNYFVDTHVHTISSGHAYSTLSDYVDEAKNKGLKMFALTDHGPEMPGASHIYHILNQRVIPRQIDGIEILRGVEANIMDFDGTIDIPEKYMFRLDLVIASLHPPCIESGSKDENTRALINAMKNPGVDIIGHSGNPDFPIHIEAFVKAAKEYNCIIEINNSSDNGSSRKGSLENCIAIARMAARYDVLLTTGSDAHFKSYLGDFEHIKKIFQEAGVKEEQVITRSPALLKKYLKDKGKLNE